MMMIKRATSTRTLVCRSASNFKFTRVQWKLLNLTFHALRLVRNYVVPYSICGLLQPSLEHYYNELYPPVSKASTAFIRSDSISRKRSLKACI